MGCASDNHNYMCHTCAKEFSNLSFNLAVIDKNINFSRYCPKFHIFTKIVIFQVYFLDQMLLPYMYTFYGIDMSGILFFIFASCEPLSAVERVTLLLKVSLWYSSLLTNTIFCFLYFRISNC